MIISYGNGQVKHLSEDVGRLVSYVLNFRLKDVDLLVCQHDHFWQRLVAANIVLLFTDNTGLEGFSEIIDLFRQEQSLVFRQKKEVFYE